jgi:hypothetical protein
MMQPTNSNSFDIQPIMSEVEKVIQCGLNKLLVNYIERHELLERTHQQLLQLPSIFEEFKSKKYATQCNSNLTQETSTNAQTNIEIYNVDLEHRLDKVEKRLDAIIPILDKLLTKITHLNDDIIDIKNEKEQSVTQIQVNNAEKSSVVKTSENENIEIHIVESEEEEDKDDINPLMITCSTISLKVEDKKAEEILIEQEEEKTTQEEVEVEEEQVEEEQVEEEQVEVEEEEVEEEQVEVEEEQVEVEEEEQVEEEEEQVEEEEEQVEEEEEEQVEEEEEEEEEEVEEEASVETETKDKEEEDEEEEIFEIEIDDKTYCTNNDENGFIWDLNDEGEQGEKVGYLKDGEPFFYADEN